MAEAGGKKTRGGGWMARWPMCIRADRGDASDRCSTRASLAREDGPGRGIETEARGLKACSDRKGCVVNSLYHTHTKHGVLQLRGVLEIGDIPMTSLNEEAGRGKRSNTIGRVERIRARHPSISAGEKLRAKTGASSRRGRAVGMRRGSMTRAKVLSSMVTRRPNKLNVFPARTARSSTNKKRRIRIRSRRAGGSVRQTPLRFGALEYGGRRRVTMVHRARDSRQCEVWIKPISRNRIKKREIRRISIRQVAEIHDRLGDRINTPKGRGHAEKNDFVFAMNGYRQDKKAGRARHPFLSGVGRPYTDPETLESDRQGDVFWREAGGGHAHQTRFSIENGRSTAENRRGHCRVA